MKLFKKLYHHRAYDGGSVAGAERRATEPPRLTSPLLVLLPRAKHSSPLPFPGPNHVVIPPVPPVHHHKLLNVLQHSLVTLKQKK